MNQPLIRDGVLVGSMFSGMSYDLSKLSADQTHAAVDLQKKASAGSRLGADDVRMLMKLRKAAQVEEADPLERLASLVKQFKEVMR